MDTESQCATVWRTQNHLAADRDSQDTCALPAHWDPPDQWLGGVGHTHLKFKMLWLRFHLRGPKSGPETHYKCVFCKESLIQPPQWQLHRTDYFLAFCPTCAYKHTQRSRLKPAKTAAHVAKRYHACLTYGDVNSPQGPADPRWSLVEKASRQYGPEDAWVSR